MSSVTLQIVLSFNCLLLKGFWPNCWHALNGECSVFSTMDRSSGSPSFVQSTWSNGGWEASGHVMTPSIPVGRYVCRGIWRAWAGSEHSLVQGCLLIYQHIPSLTQWQNTRICSNNRKNICLCVLIEPYTVHSMLPNQAIYPIILCGRMQEASHDANRDLINKILRT